MKIEIDVNLGLSAGAQAFIASLLSGVSLPAPAALSPTETSDTSQDEAPKETAKPRGRTKKETAKPAEVPADDKAQDAADEQAETEAAAPPEPDVTKDDIRTALGDYSKAYGMDVTMEDGPKLMGFPSVSSVPETQDAMRAAIAAIRGAIEANPYGRAKA